MLEWFRMYTEARTDAKLCILTDAEHRVWFNLLCFAAAQEGESRGGIYGFDDELLAVEICGGDTERLRATIERLKKLRILKEDESGLTFCAFEKRQYDKPSDKPERVKQRVAAFRARNKQKSNAHVTPSNALSHVGNAIDSDTDTDTDNHSAKSESVSDVLAADAPEPSQGEPLKRTRKHTPAPVNPLWDVLVEVFGEPTTKPEKSNYGRVVRDLREVDATPDDVRLRVANHARSCDWDLTINALVSHWTELGRPPNPSRPRQNGRATVPDIPSTIPRLSD